MALRGTDQDQVLFSWPSTATNAPPPESEGVLGPVSRLIAIASQRWKLTLAATLLISTALSCCFALSRRPWVDEAYFASIPYNLLHRGFFGMTILDPHGWPFSEPVEGINRFTFWVMPGYLLAQAVWYKIVGFQLFTMRAFSMLWGATALAAWFYIVRWLTRDGKIALLAVFLLGVEQNFVMTAGTGRMDMMCAALGLLSVAIYLRLRARFERALIAAALVLALALFTHPNAIFAGIMLAALVISCDRRQITIRSVLLAALPFLIFGGLWIAYVLQAPDIFVSQMRAQARIPYRFQVPLDFYTALLGEIKIRYAQAYNIGGSFPLGIFSLIFYLYIAAAAVIGLVPRLRRAPGAKFLLVITGISFLLLMAFQKNWYYLIFILPLYTALLALAVGWLWSKTFTLKLFALMVVLCTTALHFAMVGARLLRNDYHNQFLPVTEYLRRHAGPGTMILGSGELGFELGFDGKVIDDARLGLTSGNRPDYIVLDSQYKVYWFNWLLAYEPDVFRKMGHVLNADYELVCDTRGTTFNLMNYSEVPYEIYRRRADGSRTEPELAGEKADAASNGNSGTEHCGSL